MKRLLLILSLFIAVTFSFQQCKAQVNHLFWAHNNNEFAGYGLLYNWYAASDANFASSGWHVPSNAEFATLSATLGGNTVAGGKLKATGLQYWFTPNTGADNSSGFSAYGGGRRSGFNGTFVEFKSIGNFWSTTPSSTEAYKSYVQNNSDDYSQGLYGTDRQDGISIRLIKNNSTNEGDLIDYDGNVYKTITIGTQIWTTSNFKCLHLNDGTPIPIVTDNTDWSNLTTGGACYYNNNPKYK